MVALDQGHAIDVMSLLADETDYALEFAAPDHSYDG